MSRSVGKVCAILGISFLISAGACARQPDVEKVPVGTEVQLTRNDGAFVEGKLTSRDEKTVTVDVGRTTKVVPKDAVQSVRVRDESKPAAPPPPEARFREITLPEGTPISLTINTAVSSATAKVEDIVDAEVAAPVVRDGVTLIPAGSNVRGVVTGAQESGKVKGRARLSLRFDRVVVNGESYPIDAGFSRVAESTKESDAKKIGIPAAGGAVVGAIIGGGKGAAIGAAVGGGAGTAVVLSTSGHEISLPKGTTLSLKTGQSFDVKVPLRVEGTK